MEMQSSDSEDEVEIKPLQDDNSSESSYDEWEQIDQGAAMEETSGDKIGTSQATMQQQPLPRRKRFIPKYEVEGVHTVVLGEETQIQIEMVIGTDINAQHPWKFVSREKILDSIEVGKELSEFFPLKEYIEKYPEELILMGYIADESKDDDEYYVCCTIEAKDHCKQQSDRFIKRQEKKLEKAVQKKPRPWISLGSEQEIMQLVPINTRPLIEMEVKSKFPSVYQPKKFQVRDTNSVRDGFIELTPFRQKFNVIFRRRIDTGSQATPAKVAREAQTVLRYPQNKWTQSIADALGSTGDTDGGGDAGRDKNEGSSDDDEEDIKKEQPDDVGLKAYKAAFVRLRRPSYIKTLNTFISDRKDDINSIVELNTVMDMYRNDYPLLVKGKATGVFDSMTFEEYVCFTDVRAKNMYVSTAVFHPMWTGIVAISYADGSPTVMKFLGSRPDPIARAVYGLNPVMIWSHIDSLNPKLYLESPREVKVLSFCPFDENLLIGGCVNGQIVIWDLANKLENVEKVVVLSEKREKYRIAMNSHMGWMKSVEDISVVPATALSNLMTSHYGPVNAIKWLSPNFVVTATGKQIMSPDNTKSLMFLSGSQDGNILIWNLKTESINAFENKKVKKSKRVLVRPVGLMADFSPYKKLDRTLQPCYKLILGVAGQPQILPLQTLGMNYPNIKYTYTPRTQNTGRKYFKSDIVPQDESEMTNYLYCGSQHGEMRKVSWEGHEFNTGELVNSEYSELDYSCCIHDGIISCTLKNPILNSVTLTVGGKIFAIWSDKLKHKPLIWKKRPHRLTDAVWSLNKPSLLFISTCEGDLETWDFLLKSDQPICVQTLSGTMLTGVSLHTLPLVKNIIAVSDTNGTFKMFLNPPIFMIENPAYIGRMEALILRELKVMQSFIAWQEEWKKNNPQVMLELKRKELAVLAEKEEEKRRLREEEEKRLEEEAEAQRLKRLRVIGPEERWQMIIQSLIERTIAVKKRIDRAQLIEDEKPLRELEKQRLEKERRMLDVMKNQKTIFNDTVAILFPEAIKKKLKEKKSLLPSNKDVLKKEYLEDYEHYKAAALVTVKENPYVVSFSWDATLAEGKERREALNAYEDFVKMHKIRIETEDLEPPRSTQVTYKSTKIEEEVDEDEELQE